jgi:hypothetical protein
MKVRDLKVYGDSSLIIFQTIGKWKTTDLKLLPYHRYLEDLKKFRFIEFNYMPRS